MKKGLFLIFIFMIICLFVMFSCNMSNTDESNTKTTTTIKGSGIYIIDHNSLIADSIPINILDIIRTMDIYFERASVGGNIISGLEAMSSANSSRYSLNLGYREADDPNVDSTVINWFSSNNGLLHYNRGNPGFDEKLSRFNTRIRTTGFASLLDVASFKFCYIDDDYSGSAQEAFDSVKNIMENLENNFPNVKFIWWTMPIQTTGNSKRDSYNSLVRDYCSKNNKYLIDIADIECHSPEGVKQTDSIGETLFSSYTDDGGHLNSTGSLRVANAYWVILARIVGWIN